MDQQVSIGLVTVVMGPLTGAIGVLFWALVAALTARAKRAEDQVDSMLPEMRAMTAAVEKMATIVQARNP